MTFFCKNFGVLDIIVALQNSDEVIFRQVFDEYHKKVYAKVFHKTQSKYLAEEVVQLTFIKLWKYRASLKETFTLSTQIFRIASTTLIDLLRKEYTDNKKKSEQKNESQPQINDATYIIDEKEVNIMANRLMDALPYVRRRAFEMSRFCGLSYKEIALQLQISEKSVENHIYKATRQLRRHLQADYIKHTLIFFIFFCNS